MDKDERTRLKMSLLSATTKRGSSRVRPETERRTREGLMEKDERNCSKDELALSNNKKGIF